MYVPLPGALTQFLKKLRFTGLIWLLDNIYIILCLWYVDFNNINSNIMIKTDKIRVSIERRSKMAANKPTYLIL